MGMTRLLAGGGESGAHAWIVPQSVTFGIGAQGIVFGLIHPRGWRMVLTICVLGWLYGLLATLRKDLKPNMRSQAISDLWEGWLKHLIS